VLGPRNLIRGIKKAEGRETDREQARGQGVGGGDTQIRTKRWRKTKKTMMGCRMRKKAKEQDRGE